MLLLKIVLTMAIQYVLIMFFIFLQVLPEPLNLLTHPTSCFFPLSQYKNQENKTETKKINTSNQNKTIPRTTTKTPNWKNDRKANKSHGVHFVVVTYSWAWGLLWSVVDTTSITLLEKTDIPLSTDIHCKYS